MSHPRCPRCGAPLRQAQPDPMARCSWCGALLASGAWPERAMLARPRLKPKEARSAVARALAQRGHHWLPGAPQLIYYPFALTGLPRAPYQPLAPLPPLLRDGWAPQGVDLLTLDSDAGARQIEADGAVRVPVSKPTLESQPIVHYPFYRVPLQLQDRDSAAWCDASIGQTILPDGLDSPSVIPGEDGAGRTLFRWVLGALGAGICVALLLPFHWAVAACAGLAAGLWWKAAAQ